MAYDSASRLTSATDRIGNVINYSYDSINRKIGVSHPPK
jgi:YD repeat-containing protein